MDYPHRGSEDRRHHHHSHPLPAFARPEEEGRGYEGERLYPPTPSAYDRPPHVPGPFAHTAYVPGPYTDTPPGPYGSGHGSSGPYGTHGSSGPYYSQYPPEPSVEALASEVSCQPELPQGQLVRIFCKKNQAFNLAVDHDTVIMKPANTEDEAQQWIKDISYGMRVKDNYGHPAFSLVNKKARKILKHSKEKGQQVLLMDYRPDIRDDDILWSESQDFGEGFKTVRCASDTLLNLTVFEGLKTVRNGSALVLDTWHKGDHQLWKVFTLW